MTVSLPLLCSMQGDCGWLVSWLGLVDIRLCCSHMWCNPLKFAHFADDLDWKVGQKWIGPCLLGNSLHRGTLTGPVSESWGATCLWLRPPVSLLITGDVYSWVLGQISMRYFRICIGSDMFGTAAGFLSFISSMSTGAKQMAKFCGFILFRVHWAVTRARWSMICTRQFWKKISRDLCQGRDKESKSQAKLISHKFDQIYPVGFGKTVQNWENQLGVPIWVVRQEHAHGIH